MSFPPPPPPLALRRAGPAFGGEEMNSIYHYVLLEDSPYPTQEALHRWLPTMTQILLETEDLDKDQQRRLARLHGRVQFGRARSKRSVRKTKYSFQSKFTHEMPLCWQLRWIAERDFINDDQEKLNDLERKALFKIAKRDCPYLDNKPQDIQNVRDARVKLNEEKKPRTPAPRFGRRTVRKSRKTK